MKISLALARHVESFSNAVYDSVSFGRHEWNKKEEIDKCILAQNNWVWEFSNDNSRGDHPTSLSARLSLSRSVNVSTLIEHNWNNRSLARQ